MKFFILLVFVFLPFQSKGQVEIKKLKVAYLNLSKNSTLENQHTFFELFPNSFESFINAFGFNNGNESLIYKDQYNYIETFFKLDSVTEERQINKWINISINGKWDADAVSLFQGLLRKQTLEKNELTYTLLKKRTDTEIISFFFFYFNEIHPPKNWMPKKLKEFYKKDNNFYQLIEKGRKKAIEKSGH
jgi:hypothetical protein